MSVTNISVSRNRRRATTVRRGTARRPRREPSRALFGAFLRGMRINASQAAVAKSCGRSPGWLARYEKGLFVHPPTFEDLRVLCSVLGINPVELLLDCGFITEAEIAEAALAGQEPRVPKRAVSWAR